MEYTSGCPFLPAILIMAEDIELMLGYSVANAPQVGMNVYTSCKTLSRHFNISLEANKN